LAGRGGNERGIDEENFQIYAEAVKTKTKPRLTAIDADDPRLPAWMKRRIRELLREERGQPVYSFKTVEAAMAHLESRCKK